MEQGERSFLQVITEENVPILTGRIKDVRQVVTVDGEEHGQVLLGEIREVSNGRWKRSDDLSLPYHRYKEASARIKSGSQGWNGIPLEPGHYLVVAVSGSPTLEAIAVRSIEGPDDNYVKDIAWCLATEQQADPQVRLARIREAILSKEELLDGYGHYAAGRLKRIPRADAVGLEVSVLAEKGNDEETRIAAAQTLELELWDSDRPGDELNLKILKAMWEALVEAPEELQNSLAEALSRLIIDGAPGSEAEAREYKASLRRAIAKDADPKLAKIVEEWGRRQDSKEDAGQLVKWLRH